MFIKIEKKSKIIFINPSDENDEIELIVTQPSIANKLKLYAEYLESILDTKVNKQWYFNILKKFKLTQDDDVIYKDFLDRSIEIGLHYTSKMVKVIDFSSWVNYKKKTSNSIFFEQKECYDIYLLSSIVKLYAMFSGTNLVHLNLDKINKKSFEYIIEKLNLEESVKKIHRVVYTKLFKCIGLDPIIMRTISLRSTMTDEDFVLYLFDYVLSAILIIYDMERNPITFIVTSIDQVMIWHFRGLYQKSIVYKETGELFGKSLASTNLPERIISDKIYDYVQNFVSLRNQENGVIIQEDSYGTVDRYLHNFLVVPIYRKIFSLKHHENYNTFQRLNIQLFLYYTMKDYINNMNGNLFPKVNDENLVKDKNEFEKYKMLEIFKRIPLTLNEKHKIMLTNVYEEDEFFIDDTNRKNRNYINFQYDSSYKIDCIKELLTSQFKFYGINNIMILNNYLKIVMSLVTTLVFKNLFTFDLTKSEFKCKKFSSQLELEIFPFLMVILDNKMQFFTDYVKYISNVYCINKEIKNA